MRFKMEPTTGISGLGSSVYKLIDTQTGEILGYVGEMEGQEVLHLAKPILIRRLIHIANQFAGQQEVPVARPNTRA
jgi:hypothetical protein